jgi:hypothetical protein
MNRTNWPMVFAQLSLFSQDWLMNKGYITKTDVDGETVLQITPAGWEYIARIEGGFARRPE